MLKAVRRASERKLAIEALERREVLSGVVTIGDSWAWLVAAGAPGSAPSAPSGFSNSLGTVMATFQPGVPVYNESFGGGTAAQMVDELYAPGGVIDRVNAHPDADVVWLSAGGNDLLLGLLGGGFYVGNPNNAAVFNAMRDNVATIVDAILAERADLQVVIMGYDYLNIWDMVSGSAGDNLRANLGVGKTGNTLLDALQNEDVNDGFKQAELGKKMLAADSRRVAHVDNFGLNNTYGGYSGYFGNFPAGSTYPPELYPALPTPASRMNPGDPIHLNDLGYTTLALHAEQDFLLSAFSSASLALSTGALAFGDVRIGTSAVRSTTASNVGANFTKVQDLMFEAATGPFSGGGQAFDPLFADPTLGSDTATVSYTFTPSGHGPQAQALAVTSDSGSPGLSLSGDGVGPEYDALSAVIFDAVDVDDTGSAGLMVSNATLDGDLGTLTDLSLLSYSITGSDAARFALVDFDPATIAAGGQLALDLAFDAAGAAPGEYTAVLQLTTDQGAAFGTPGQTFEVALSVEVNGVLSDVIGRYVFYNESAYDGHTPGVDASDDGAIAPDKTAYLPGTGTASFDNITSYSRGINGVMVDVTNTLAPLSAADFTFQVSEQTSANNTPSLWAAAPAPTGVTVRPGAGAFGSDRVEIVWAAGAITNRWLQVIVEGNDAAGGFNTGTGLLESDIFYFGNRIGDTGSGTPGLAITSALDEIAVRGNFGLAGSVANLYDFDRNGLVTALDAITSRNNAGTLTKIDITDPPAVPSALVAAALAAPVAEDDGWRFPSPAVEVPASDAALASDRPGSVDAGAGLTEAAVLRVLALAADAFSDEADAQDSLLDDLL